MKQTMFILPLVFLLILNATLRGQVVTGAEHSGRYYSLIHGKRVGLVVNSASVSGGILLPDRLLRDSMDIRLIFSPEHGFRMQAEAGEKVDHSIDAETGIRVVSLYGKNRKPSSDDMREVDVILFDLQDVGVRFFTYISTMTYMMEACYDAGIPMIVLDRPNPNGFYIDGPVLEPEFKSFVGLHPVPVVYGMTIGEYAMMVNGEGWLPGKKRCSLTVIPLTGYTRNQVYAPIVRPSPNLPDINAILLYPSLCFFEGTTVSVGRGTPFPFEVYGHPAFDSTRFSFIPLPVPGMSSDPPHNGVRCYGEDLRNYYTRNPHKKGRIDLEWLIMGYRKMKSNGQYFNAYFNQLAGTSELRYQIEKGLSEKKIRDSWRPGLERFRKIRSKYLLYPD